MTTIKNTRELPVDLLRCFAMTEAEAIKAATQYQSAWFYPLSGTDKGYLYLVETEYQEKNNNGQSNHSR